MPWHRHLLPMIVKIGYIDDFLPDGEDLSSCRIVLGLQKDQGGTVFAHCGGFFAQIAPADVSALLWIVLVKIIELRHQLSGSDGTIGRVKRHGHVPGAGTAPAFAIGAEDGVRNRVPKHQSAKRMGEQDGVMIVLPGFTRGDREFFNGREAAVRRGDPSAGRLAAPKREKIQSWCGEVLPTPADVNADDIDFPSRELGKTGDRVEKMLEATHIAGSSVVLPAMNVNKEQWTFRFMDDFKSHFSLRIIQGRALISKFDEGHFITSIRGT